MPERKAEAVFWVALAGAFASVAGLLCFEAYARGTGKIPTISERAAFAAVKHPGGALGITFSAGTVLGALASHFGGWLP